MVLLRTSLAQRDNATAQKEAIQKVIGTCPPAHPPRCCALLTDPFLLQLT